MNHPVKKFEARGWVFYDASCGFCNCWIPFWRQTLERRGFSISTLQSDLAKERLGLSDDSRLDDLRLFLVTGEHIQGADVYRYVMRRIWWAYPFFLMSIAPGVRLIFNWGYRTFADHRFRISNACNLRNKR